MTPNRVQPELIHLPSGARPCSDCCALPEAVCPKGLGRLLPAFSFLVRAGKNCSKRTGAAGQEEYTAGWTSRDAAQVTSAFAAAHQPAMQIFPPASVTAAWLCPFPFLPLTGLSELSIRYQAFHFRRRKQLFRLHWETNQIPDNSKGSGHTDALQFITLERKAASMLLFQPDPFIYIFCWRRAGIQPDYLGIHFITQRIKQGGRCTRRGLHLAKP